MERADLVIRQPELCGSATSRGGGGGRSGRMVRFRKEMNEDFILRWILLSIEILVLVEPGACLFAADVGPVGSKRVPRPRYHLFAARVWGP